MTGISSTGNRTRGRTARTSIGLRRIVVAGIAAILFASLASAADVAGTARLIRERRAHTATAIGNGKILVTGGQNLSGALSDVEIFDSAGTFTAAARLLTPRADHTATRLADGRVLLIGGRGGEPLTSTEFFDASRNVFSSGPSLNSPRFGHTATPLPDGRIVVIGGNAEGTAEIFDPRANTFTALPCHLSEPRSLHAAVRLLDGSILIAGGISRDGVTLKSAEILHPDTLECEPTASMFVARSRFTLRLLPDGKVQAIGGDTDATMEIFNPTGYFSSLVHLARAPEFESAAMRSAGRVALIGPSAGAVADSEVPIAGGRQIVRPVQSLLDRIDYSMTELPEAGIAMAAGGVSSAGRYQQTAVLFEASSATVTTDKTDYAPGETVIITGSGWLPGETVTLNIHRDTNDPPDTVLTAVADVDGNITNSVYVVQEYDLGVTFLLTATGQTSGYTAQTSFTDGNIRIRTNAEGITFDLDWVRVDNTTCDGAVLDSDTEDDVGFSGGDRFTKGVGNTESISLEAEPFSDQGGPFINWTSPGNPSIPAVPTTSLTICVPGFTGGGTREYVANYGPCLNPAISVGGQPVSQTVCPNSSASFAVTATGTNLSYQWKKNGVSLADGGNISGATSATLTINPATAADNGSYTVVISGNCGSPVTSAPATLTVADTTAPVPNVSSLPTVTGQCSATIASVPTATDNCAGTVTATTSDPLSYTTQGTFTVTWTYDDGNGNTTTQTQTVVVDDTTAPVPDVASLAAATGECSATISSTPTATDNCEGTITATTSDSLTRTTQGTSTVTWTYDDGNGNTATQTQSIVVDDVTAPVPNAASLPAATGECSATISSTPTATDNCEGTITGTTSDPLTRTTQGTSTVTWTYDDGNGNTTTQTQSIVVDDVTAPVPNAASLPAATGECSATISSTPTATDNCEGTITGTTSDPLTRTTQGTSSVTWTYDDGNGNTTTQTQSIVVDDVTAPVPNVTTLPTITEQCSASVTAPTATDNCAGQITATTTDPTSFTADGTYTIHWTYDDGNGNTTTQDQTVIVDDTIAPVPNVTTLPTITEQCSATVTAPTATDNCAGNVTATTTDPTSFTADGTYTIHWTYDDGNGNTTTQDQTVIVDDTIAPVPNVGSLTTITEQCSATVTAPTATDNCAGQITATTTDPTSFTADGTYTIQWTYDDGRGNTTTQTQTVIVDDTIAPVPNVAPLPTITEQCSATVTAPTATDNCSGQITATTTDPTSFTADGTYTIQWTYDDGRGNTTTQTQTVIVQDTIAPVIASCAPPTSALAGVSCLAPVPNVTGNVSASDNCTASGALTITQSPAPGTMVGLGPTTITITVKDAVGNTSTCMTTFTVTNDAPVITSVTGPSDPVQVNTPTSVTATFTDTGLQGHTCTFNWEDGTSSVTVGPGVTSCTSSHTYTTQGIRTISVDVADDCGGQSGAVNATEYVVVFDPNGPFVTGGGWINSPEGAYSGGDVTGKANFGFVSKYQTKNSTTTLAGETEFQFKAGDLNFHSSSYEWLVVSGAKARYRGVGTINGSGSYAFELTAWDGQISGGGGVDKIRMKIWADNQGNGVLYDNQVACLDQADGATPCTALGGGSIVIHKGK
jgi:hypothetical protein